MIDHCSIIFQSGQMPTDMTPPVSRESAWCTLSFSWLTVTLGIQVVPDGSKVNWFGEGCLRGSDWEAEGPPWVSSVKCSPVSHTDTLLFALSTIGSSALSWKKRKKKKNEPAVCGKKKKKKLSTCLVLCSQPELDEYSHGENTSGMQHQQRCLASCIYWFFVIVACFFI